MICSFSEPYISVLRIDCNSSDSPCREVKIALQRRRAALQLLRDLCAPKCVLFAFCVSCNRFNDLSELLLLILSAD